MLPTGASEPLLPSVKIHTRKHRPNARVAMVLELPRSVLGVLLEYADHRSIHQLEATCRPASELIHATGMFSLSYNRKAWRLPSEHETDGSL